METLLIIQARMGSKRLPGKILKKLGDADVLSYVVKRSREISGVEKIVIATSNLEIDNSVSEWCEKENIECFRGSEENVLSRFTLLNKIYNPKYIIRVTADCPFIDIQLAEKMLEAIKEKGVDFIFYNEEVIPRGISVEVFSSKALRKIGEKATETYHKEHVTYYAYENANEFSQIEFNLPEYLKHPEMRLTLDTEEDYILLNLIAKRFNNIYEPTTNIIEFLSKESDILKINADIQQKSVK